MKVIYMQGKKYMQRKKDMQNKKLDYAQGKKQG